MSPTEASGGSTFAARAQLSIARLLSRNVLIVAVALAAAVVLAWAWLAASGQAMSAMVGHGMAMMRPEPLTAGYLLPAFGMWALMMVAMMLPSATPMILLHARIDRSPSNARKLWHSLLFIFCYLLVWTGFSALAAVSQALLIEAGLVEVGSLALGGTLPVAAVLAGAALYQMTAAKAACLDQCRSPLHFILRYWRPGIAGTVRLGIVHGLYCLGCCWALMLLLFVGGVMNLAWVALLALLVTAEKLAPPAWRANLYLAAALAAAAVWVLMTG